MKHADRVRDIYSKITASSWKKKFPETAELYQRLNPYPDFDKLVPAALEMWLDTSEDGHPGERIRNAQCEQLLVRGDDDHLVSREATIGLLDRVKGAKFSNIAFAGHVAFADQPDVFATTVNYFLNERKTS